MTPIPGGQSFTLNVIHKNNTPTIWESVCERTGMLFIYSSFPVLFVGFVMCFMSVSGVDWLKEFECTQIMKYTAWGVVSLVFSAYLLLVFSQRRAVLNFDKKQCCPGSNLDPVAWEKLNVTIILRNGVGGRTSQISQVKSIELDIVLPDFRRFIYGAEFNYGIESNEIKALRSFLLCLPDTALIRPDADWSKPATLRAYSSANRTSSYAWGFNGVMIFCFMGAAIYLFPDGFNSACLFGVPFLPPPVMWILIFAALSSWITKWGVSYTRDYLYADMKGVHSKQHGLMAWNSITRVEYSISLHRDWNMLAITFLSPDLSLVVRRWRSDLFCNIAPFVEACEAGRLQFGNLKSG